MARDRTLINRVGSLTLFRWRDGTATLSLVEDGDTAYAPTLPGWTPFFVGRHRTYTRWSYRRVTA